MKVSQSVELENGVVTFSGELSQQEADAILSMGLTMALANGAFPEVTKALFDAQKEDEAAQGYAFPDDMDKND